LRLRPDLLTFWDYDRLASGLPHSSTKRPEGLLGSQRCRLFSSDPEGTGRVAILASLCNLDTSVSAYALTQLRVCGPTKLSASTPGRLASIPVPSFLPATRRRQFSKGLGILSYTAGTGFAFKHPGDEPRNLSIRSRTLYDELMQSTRTCSPVAPSGFGPTKYNTPQSLSACGLLKQPSSQCQRRSHGPPPTIGMATALSRKASN
jgi:hypothetical protein